MIYTISVFSISLFLYIIIYATRGFKGGRPKTCGSLGVKGCHNKRRQFFQIMIYIYICVKRYCRLIGWNEWRE